MGTQLTDNQVRLAWVPLTDSVIRCFHGWPVEGSVCPMCEPKITNGTGYGKITEEELWGYSIGFSSDSGEAGGS